MFSFYGETDTHLVYNSKPWHFHRVIGEMRTILVNEQTKADTYIKKLRDSLLVE